MARKRWVVLRGGDLDGRVVADAPPSPGLLRLGVTVDGEPRTAVYVYDGSTETDAVHGVLPVMRFWQLQEERRSKTRPFRGRSSRTLTHPDRRWMTRFLSRLSR